MALYPTPEEMLAEEKQLIALNRAEELRSKIQDYLEERQNIPTGFDLHQQYTERKQRIMHILQATEEQWDDWKWQMANRIKDPETLNKIFNLNPQDMEQIKKVGAKYRWSISPYYASLMTYNPKDPIWLQAVPSKNELKDFGVDDPMGEEYTSPAPCITRRYPDRLIINVTNQCAMYCRHCQRRRNIGETDSHKPKAMLEKALEYIRANKEIRDVLITGGDALLLADKTIEWLLKELNQIKHVEIKRLGTRTLVTLPQRITPELCAILEKYPPIYINSQFNHPREITPEVKKACDMLIKAGVVLGNQAVLLKNINNNPHVMKKLNHELLKIRIRPYYIFHAKEVRGTGHFITSVDDGLKIMEKLRGYTSGLAIPTYIINAPKGYGKTPVIPRYVLNKSEGEVVLRTWENRIIHYKDRVSK